MSNLYERFSELCKERKTTITTVCHELGIQPSTFHDIKAGRKQSCSADKAALIADYFGVSVSYLLGFTDERINVRYEKPEINMLARAGHKMTPDQLDGLLRYAKMMYPEYFEEDEQNNT